MVTIREERKTTIKEIVTEKKAETELSTEVHQEGDSEMNIEAIVEADMNPEIEEKEVVFKEETEEKVANSTKRMERAQLRIDHRELTKWKKSTLTLTNLSLKMK